MSVNREIWSTIYMAMFWSILGPRTNLIDGKCSKFNGEIDNVFSLGSKT
jgi:hypothetical protein